LAKSKAGVNDAIKKTLSYIWNNSDISLDFSAISIYLNSILVFILI
jgi:hypothetical protein